MLKNILLLVFILSLAGCAGIPFCNDKGQPPGCRHWDPATTNGAGIRS
jgi:hypothetical protein